MCVCTLPDCKVGAEADGATRDGLARNEEDEGIEFFSPIPAVNDAALPTSTLSVGRETLAPDTEGDTVDRDSEGDTVASDSEDRLTASFMPPLGGCMEGDAAVPDNEDRLTASFTPPIGRAVNGPSAIRPPLLESILVWDTLFGARLIAELVWAGIPSEMLLFDARLALLPSLRPIPEPDRDLDGDTLETDPTLSDAVEPPGRTPPQAAQEVASGLLLNQHASQFHVPAGFSANDRGFPMKAGPWSTP